MDVGRCHDTDGNAAHLVYPVHRIQSLGILQGEHMILSQGKLADGLVDDLLEAIHKYDETLYMSTVIGVLELVKQQLINESVESQDDND
jgi:hypothetical protein